MDASLDRGVDPVKPVGFWGGGTKILL